MQSTGTSSIPGGDWPQVSPASVEIGILDELRIGLQRMKEARFSWWDD